MGAQACTWRSPRGPGAPTSARTGCVKGIRVKTASYARHHVNVTMARAKVSGTYRELRCWPTLEATQHGYDEGLLLDVDGFVAEGAGENIFIVKDGRVWDAGAHLGAGPASRGASVQSSSPPAWAYGVRAKTRLTRDDVYIADEAFFTEAARDN
jgi:branched-chain amino acid aminotransferase